MQIAFLLLLLVCVAQMAWWIGDEAAHSSGVRDRQERLYAADAGAGAELLALGTTPERIEQLFPHLVVHDGEVLVRAEDLEELQETRRRRLNRYGWEGSFFLLVLLAGMGVILQALRQNANLLRRQQNFLASVSHELRSPLAGLKLSAETLLLRRPEGEAALRLADRMVRDADRLETLVGNLLDVGALEEGEVEVRPSTHPLGALVDQAVAGLQPHLEGGIQLDLAVPDGLTVYADAESFRTVLRNLLSNAAKSTAAQHPDGGGHVRLAARSLGADRGQVELVVQDDGLGFERGQAGRLFDKFYRPGDEMRRRTKGSGLGLYIVRHLVKLHGATVSARSEGPGLGAEFTLRWPAEAPRP